MATVTDWPRQREIIAEEIDKAEADLRQMAGDHEGLSLDVAIGQAPRAKIEALEAKMKQRTADLDRARSSLAELARREQAAATAAEAAHRAKLQKELDAALLQTQGTSAKLVATVDALAAALAEAEAADRAASSLAERLGYTRSGRGLQGLRGMVHNLLASRIGFAGRIETGAVNPRQADDVAAAIAAGVRVR